MIALKANDGINIEILKLWGQTDKKIWNNFFTMMRSKGFLNSYIMIDDHLEDFAKEFEIDVHLMNKYKLLYLYQSDFKKKIGFVPIQPSIRIQFFMKKIKKKDIVQNFLIKQTI
jgi:hypothetical protein